VTTAEKASFAVIGGAGGAGGLWSDVAARLDVLVMPLPDEPDVPAMARSVRDRIAALPQPRVLVGASAGAMVALEIAREVPMQALVLISAGWGIEVSESALGWVRENPPDLHRKLAKICVADRENLERLKIIEADYDACTQPVHVRHLEALSRHRPTPLVDPPPTLVLWGMADRAVPMEDHLELALQCQGALVPIAEAAHVPYLEQPDVVVRWMRHAAAIAEDSAR
jgi:pimeloyl-ACP methyl ester carboxylesterase